MLQPVDWPQVKAFFLAEARRLGHANSFAARPHSTRKILTD
jgi:hypothetical protein